jgi:hypothetical protein
LYRRSKIEGRQVPAQASASTPMRGIEADDPLLLY